MVFRARETQTGLQGMVGECRNGEAMPEVWMQCRLHSGEREAQTS